MKINGSLIFDASSASEIQNLRVQKVSSNPTHTAADIGRLIYNTGDNIIYIGGASAWVALATGGNATALQTEVDAIESALGAFFNADGTFNATAANALNNVDGATTLSEVLADLDASISGKDALAELLDVDVTGVADNSLLQFNQGTGKWEDSAIGSASGVQAYDAGLDALAAKTTTGVMVQTGADTFGSATFVAPSAGVTISDTSVADGNITFALANDLAALEGLTGTGIIVRSADNTAAVRSVVGGSTGTVVVGDGNGVAGNITLDLQTLTIPTNSGNFLKFTYDTHGRVTGVQAVVAGDITGLVDATYVNVTGDSMTGNLSFGGTNTVTGLAAPSSAGDAATKAYVDNLVAGMTWEAPVLAIVADDSALPGSPTTGDRYYQADIDSIVEYNGTAWVAEALVEGAAFFNRSTDTGYVFNGTDAVPFTGGGALNAGNGLVMTGNVLDVNFGAGITMLPSDEVGVHISNYTGSALGFALAADGSRVATEAAAVSGDLLKLFLDGSSLTQSGSGLKIAAGGVTEVEINSSSLATNAGLTGGSGTKLALNVDPTHLEVATNVLTIKDAGVTTAKIADANVTNAKLANSTITVSDGTLTDAVALGETLVFAGGTGITTAVTGNQVAVSVDFADINLGDLNDVGSAAATTSGNALIANGTSWNSTKIFHQEVIAVAATTWTINHSLGQQFVNVTVMADAGSGAYEVVIPQSITMTSANQVVVTFNTAVAGAVAVMGIA